VNDRGGWLAGLRRVLATRRCQWLRTEALNAPVVDLGLETRGACARLPPNFFRKNCEGRRKTIEAGFRPSFGREQRREAVRLGSGSEFLYGVSIAFGDFFELFVRVHGGDRAANEILPGGTAGAIDMTRETLFRARHSRTDKPVLSTRGRSGRRVFRFPHVEAKRLRMARYFSCCSKDVRRCWVRTAMTFQRGDRHGGLARLRAALKIVCLEWLRRNSITSREPATKPPVAGE